MLYCTQDDFILTVPVPRRFAFGLPLIMENRDNCFDQKSLRKRYNALKAHADEEEIRARITDSRRELEEAFDQKRKELEAEFDQKRKEMECKHGLSQVKNTVDS